MDALLQTILAVTISDSIERGAYYLIFGIGGYVLFWKILPERLQRLRLYDKAPEAGQLRFEIRHSLTTLLVWAILSISIACMVHYHWIDIDKTPHGYGWIWYMLGLPFCLVVHDTYFYWTHRAIHHPKLYKYFHAAHHRSVNPTSLALFSFHPLEAMVQFGVVFIFLLFPLHWTVLLAWGIFMAAHNMVGHLGFETHLGRRGGAWVTATHHAQHHRFFTSNYGLYFRFWDVVMGTEHARYAEALAKVKAGERLPAR